MNGTTKPAVLTLPQLLPPHPTMPRTFGQPEMSTTTHLPLPKSHGWPSLAGKVAASEVVAEWPDFAGKGSVFESTAVRI
jgi:hypothetical protein